MIVFAIKSSLKILTSLLTKFLLVIFFIKLWLFIYTAITGWRFWGRHHALCQILYLVTILNKLIFHLKVLFFFSFRNSPPVTHDLLSFEASRSHSDTPQSVRLLRTIDQPDAQTSTWQHTILTTDRHPCHRRESNPQSQQASCCRITPQTAWPHTHNTSHIRKNIASIYLLQIKCHEISAYFQM